MAKDSKDKVSGSNSKEKELEKAGFYKGFRKGKVGISPKHTLSIINYDGGTASEIESLSFDIVQLMV